MKIRDMNISARARSCLMRAGYDNVEDLKDVTDAELHSIKNLNEACIIEIRSSLEELANNALGVGNSNSNEDLAIQDEFKEVLQVVFESLVDREKEVLILRFGLKGGQKCTLEEIGNEYGLSRERIRQIEAKALRKLRHPSRSRKLKKYIGTNISDTDQKIMCAIFGIKQEEWFSTEDTNSEGPRSSEELKLKGKKSKVVPEKNDIQKIPINTLELSIRSYNCLKRAGIDIVHDLTIRSLEEMMKVRNLGRKSLDEVLKKMQDLNVKLRGEEEDPFLYGYPDYVRNIASEKKDGWEYYLYIEVMIFNYELLSEFRSEKVTIREENNNPSISDFDELKGFLIEKINPIQEFSERISEALNVKTNEAFGASGEGEEIVSAASDFIRVYRDLIYWKLSFSNITTTHKYYKVVRELYALGEKMLKGVDEFYTQLIGARKA